MFCLTFPAFCETLKLSAVWAQLQGYVALATIFCRGLAHQHDGKLNHLGCSLGVGGCNTQNLLK